MPALLGRPMLATSSTSAVGLLRQNQQPSTGLPGSGPCAGGACWASMKSSRPMKSLPFSWQARSMASTEANCT